jgi:hypothetical protein
MSAVSPILNFDQNWSTFASGSPMVSSEANQARAHLAFSTADVDQDLNKIAGLMQGDLRVPTQRAFELASEWLYRSFDRACKLGGWGRPHISSTEAGEVVFEWWHNNRKLTLYFGDDGAEYIEVWGTNIDDEMSSGLLTNWSFTSAWLRLQS